MYAQDNMYIETIIQPWEDLNNLRKLILFYLDGECEWLQETLMRTMLKATNASRPIIAGVILDMRVEGIIKRNNKWILRRC